MLNDIIDAISIKLDQVFGDGCRIYSEDVKQGLKEPCFFIAVLNPSQSQIIGSRFSREYPVDIHYFPKAKENNNEMMTVTDKMMSEMDVVTMINGDNIRGNDIRFEVVDGVLHFFVKYKVIVLITDTPEDSMETLTVKTNTWEG